THSLTSSTRLTPTPRAVLPSGGHDVRTPERCEAEAASVGLRSGEASVFPTVAGSGGLFGPIGNLRPPLGPHRLPCPHTSVWRLPWRRGDDRGATDGT